MDARTFTETTSPEARWCKKFYCFIIQLSIFDGLILIYIDYSYFSRWLQKYRIKPDYHVLGWEWNKPKSVPECLLSHLETFVWRRYDWKGEKEEEVATYLLKNARGLKNATFSTGPIEPGQLDKLKQRRRTRKKIGWCAQGF